MLNNLLNAGVCAPAQAHWLSRALARRSLWSSHSHQFPSKGMLILFLVLFWFTILLWTLIFSPVNRQKWNGTICQLLRSWDCRCRWQTLQMTGFATEVSHNHQAKTQTLQNLASLWGECTSLLCWDPCLVFLGLLPHFPGEYLPLAFPETICSSVFVFYVWKYIHWQFGCINTRNSFPLGVEDIVLLHYSPYSCQSEKQETILILPPEFLQLQQASEWWDRSWNETVVPYPHGSFSRAGWGLRICIPTRLSGGADIVRNTPEGTTVNP